LVNEFRKSWVGKHNHSVGHTDTILLIDDEVENDIKRVDPESVQQTLRGVPTDDPKVNSRIIFLAAHAEHAFEIIQAAHAMKFQPDTVWVGPSSWVGQTDSKINFASWLPDIPGFIGVAPFRNNNDKVYSEFFSEFQAWQRREGKAVLRELPTFAAETVDAIVAMATALAETPASQRRDGAIVAERLRKNQFDGVSGRVEFTKEGDRKNPKYTIYNAKTSRLAGDIVWTEAGKVEFGANGPSAFVDDDVCFANPAGCGLEYVPDDKYPYKDKLPPWVHAVMAYLGLLLFVFRADLVAFHQKSIVDMKAAACNYIAFQKSIVDMKAAACNYISHICRWFKMANTRTPMADELEPLKQEVASGSLDPPKHWTTTRIANVAERHVLYTWDTERTGLLQSFLSTLGGGNSSHIQIVRVERIQNKAMYQSYIVKRQTICYRETGSDGTGDGTAQQNAMRRIERRWLWHGTNAEVVDKIMYQVRKTVLQ
jgi:hypothetical protein